MIAMKGLNQKDQILFLKGAGYEVQEIADVVRTTSHQVSVTLHDARQPRGSQRSGRKKRAK